MQISIIIPTFNRSASLKITVDSLLALSSSQRDHEIIIVDNGSTDNTKGMIEAMIGSNPDRQIRYYYEPIPGLLSGRHKGAFESKGNILVFVDDDIEADPGWLEAIAKGFEDPEVHLVGGRNLPKYESIPPDWLEAFWYRDGVRRWCDYLSVLDFGEQQSEIDPLYIWGLNFSIRRKTLFELGGFNPDYVPKPFQYYQGNAETGLAWKAKARGLKLIYQPNALIYHRIPDQRLTVDYFEQRMFLYGVSDSYTTIRRHNGIRFDWRTQAPFPQIKRLWRRVASRLSADPYATINQRVREAWLKGYAYHQDKVRNDPQLLRWVLKEDYWDYRYGPFQGSNNISEGEQMK